MFKYATDNIRSNVRLTVAFVLFSNFVQKLLVVIVQYAVSSISIQLLLCII